MSQIPMHTVAGTDSSARPVFREVVSAVNLDGSIIGGSAPTLSDVLLTDGAGTLFIARDNGTTLTYWNLNTNAAYTPSGTIQVANTLSMGTDGTGITQVTGGVGVRGWLSGLYSKLGSSIAVTGTFYQATQPVSAAALPLPTGASQDGSDATGVTNGGVGIRGWLSSIFKSLNSAIVSGLMQVTQFIGGSAVSAANPVPIYDGYGASQQVSMTSSTAAATTATAGATNSMTFITNGMDCVALTIIPTGTITTGAISFFVYDGYNWVPVKSGRETSYNTDSVYSLAGISAIQGWTINAAAFQKVMAVLTTAITGTGSISMAGQASSAPDVSVVTAGLDPLQAQHPGVLTENVFQVVAVASASAASSLTLTATNRVVLTSTVDCWVNIGAAPTAAVPTVTTSSGSFFLPASCPSYPIAVTGGTTKIAVIGNSTASGFLSILESV